MPSSELLAFNAAALAFRNTHLGATIKVSGTPVLATFTAPRLSPSLADSTLGIDRYHSTVRIPKAAVPQITTPAAWEGITLQLPEGVNWRTYKILTEAIDVHLAGEWKLDVESL